MSNLLRIRDDASSRIVVWSGDERITVEAMGTVVVVPCADEVAEPGPGGVFRYPSARGRDGKPLPGTVLLREARKRQDDGSMLAVFDPDEWSKMLASNRPELFASGFGITDDPDNVASMQAAQRPAWEAMDERRCEGVIRAEIERQTNYARYHPGEPIPAGTNQEQVRAAIARLEKRKAQRGHEAAVSRTDLIAALGGAEKAVDVGVEIEPQEPPATVKRGPGRPRRVA